MSFNDGFSIKPVPWPPNTPVSGNTLIYNGSQWVANTVYDDTVWYGTARLGLGSTISSWQSNPSAAYGGALYLILQIDSYLKCNWKFVDANGEHFHGPFADTGSFEAYVNSLKQQLPFPAEQITYAQPYDLVDNTIPKLNDFYSNNMLWSMLFNPVDKNNAMWSSNSGPNAVLREIDGGSRLSDLNKQQWLNQVWGMSYLTSFPGDWDDPLSYSCFWRATTKKNLWVWSKTLPSGPDNSRQRTCIDITDNSFYQNTAEKFQVDPSAKTSVLNVAYNLGFSYVDYMTYYTSRQKRERGNIPTSVICIPIQSVSNPQRKAIYIKPLSQDTVHFRTFDNTKYTLEAVHYGGSNIYNGYPKIVNLFNIGNITPSQNVGYKISASQFSNFFMREGNKVRFRLRHIETGRVGPFADSALVVTRDRNNRDLMRLLQKSPE